MPSPYEQDAYIVLHDTDDMWSVVDARSGLALVVDGVPMVLLSHEQANLLATAANLKAAPLKPH